MTDLLFLPFDWFVVTNSKLALEFTFIGHFFISRACTPNDSTPPHTPAGFKGEVPSFNFITATPTPSVGRVTPERGGIGVETGGGGLLNNNTICENKVMKQSRSDMEMENSWFLENHDDYYSLLTHMILTTTPLSKLQGNSVAVLLPFYLCLRNQSFLYFEKKVAHWSTIVFRLQWSDE